MAIDQTEKRRAAARELMNNVDTMMASLYAAKAVCDEITSAGLTFAAADFEGSMDMLHITTTNIGNVQTNIPLVLTEWISENLDDVFNLIRP